MTSKQDTIVSGMRPTGPLHLGHYFGVLINWINLTKDHQCYFFVADWHALTSEYKEPRKIKGFVPGLVRDFIAAGLDPEKCVIFQQSQIKEHAELHLILSMYTPTSWLERNPTYKEQMQELKQKDINSYGFLGYPVLMASDILIYRPTAVPVGQDQLPHLELTREMARRFNFINEVDLLPEPKDMLTKDPKLPGLDGRKMSKSYGNGIFLSDDIDSVKPKIMSMLTDANRMRKKDPGDPEVCNLFPYHKLMTDESRHQEIITGCKDASWGCVDCKKLLINSMEGFLDQMAERRKGLDDDTCMDILKEGNAKAREKAQETMEKVREVLNFNF